MILRAISPRLAIEDFSKHNWRDLPAGPKPEQLLAELHGLAVFYIDVNHLARNVRRNLVHEFHRLNDAQYRTFLDYVANFDVRRRSR